VGMFDEVHFPEPIKCTVCGKDISCIQTKIFEKMMEHYYVGDIVPGYFITAILRETLYCNYDKQHMESNVEQEIFLVIWHRILIDIVENYEDAEMKLKTFGMKDLYVLFDQLRRERNRYRYYFNRMVEWVRTYLKEKRTSRKVFEELSEEPEVPEDVLEESLEEEGNYALLSKDNSYQTFYLERNKYKHKFLAVKAWMRDYFRYDILSEEQVEQLLNEKRGLHNWDEHSFAERMAKSKEPFEEFLKELDDKQYYGNLIFI